MAKSRFEYVRNFETPDPLLPNTFLIVRVDGRGFHKFSDAHGFTKPNDIPALELMNRAAKTVMDDLPDVVMAFGESDEYSFLIRRSSNLYNRRRSKINSTICSLFTSAYVFYWSTYLPDRPLKYPPTFDSRVVVYPSDKEIRDYFAWRQADTHINNLYNTCFWALVQSGLSTTETNKILQGTDSKAKNEMLFSRFGVNYNNQPLMFRKGSTLVRQESTMIPSGPSERSDPDVRTPIAVSTTAIDKRVSGPSDDGERAAPTQDGVDLTSTVSGETGAPAHDQSKPNEAEGKHDIADIVQKRGKRQKKIRPFDGSTGEVVVLHEDIIGDRFWFDRPWLLA